MSLVLHPQGQSAAMSHELARIQLGRLGRVFGALTSIQKTESVKGWKSQILMKPKIRPFPEKTGWGLMGQKAVQMFLKIGICHMKDLLLLLMIFTGKIMG